MTPRFLSYLVERLLLFQKVIRSALCAYQGGYPTSHMRLYPFAIRNICTIVSCQTRRFLFSYFLLQSTLSTCLFDFVESCSQAGVDVLKVNSRSFLSRWSTFFTHLIPFN